MKDERVYLLHAVEAIEAILSYTADGSDAFFADGKTRTRSYATLRSSAKSPSASPSQRARWPQRSRGARSPGCATS